ncbi:ABC transporter permease [Pseudomonas oryzihabitans]|uniref:ABC transporter permease n=1 Tax=Pseudomonas oryzihabitans TaxID=47885 RepID=UPI0028570A7B|nr:ABC transporter permease [Pseudomonas psychrotolerans]MDR6677556.1 peptide/nickel transport system permease protein [Pseudomonas psychrotolerans]
MPLLAFPLPRAAGQSERLGRALLRSPTALTGGLLLLLVLLVAVSANWLFPHDPLDMVGMPLLWPGEDPAFPLGTDSLGRDVAAGLAHGARTSLLIALLATALSVGLGVLVGALAGYHGGWLGDALQRLTEVFQTVPSFLLVVVIVAIGTPTVGIIALAIGLASWPTVARIVRAEFRSLKSADFVLAARSQGFASGTIILREMLPNVLAAVVVTTSILIAQAILVEAGLAFLGMSDPNSASWGGMIGSGREQIASAWYLTALPGQAIVTVGLAFNLLGDGLNDALNPRLRRYRP